MLFANWKICHAFIKIVIINKRNEQFYSTLSVLLLRFSRNITHLIFWNGRQETLDKAHDLRTEISIISPHWVFKWVLWIYFKFFSCFILDLCSVIHKFFIGVLFLFVLNSRKICFALIYCRCFMNLTRANEGPFLLYGVKNLAIPMRLMAMGRMGTVDMVTD